MLAIIPAHNCVLSITLCTWGHTRYFLVFFHSIIQVYPIYFSNIVVVCVVNRQTGNIIRLFKLNCDCFARFLPLFWNYARDGPKYAQAQPFSSRAFRMICLAKYAEIVPA